MQDTRTMTICHDKLLEHVNELADRLTAGTMSQRLVPQAARHTGTGPETVEWLNDFGRRFDRLIARAERRRNAAVHGAATIPAVLRTVEPFMARLSGRIVREKLEAAATEVPALHAMEDARYKVLRRKDRLRSGETAREALFESQPQEGQPEPPGRRAERLGPSSGFRTSKALGVRVSPCYADTSQAIRRRG
jgi:hypothetical protein